MILVGHVTKEGLIAGPRVLEHMVDTVLYFEGERGHQFRILRAVKNRFGPTDEIGVFEMTDAGLPRCRTPRRCSSPSARARPRARRSSPAWKARGRCWSRSRRWSRLRASARRAAPWSAGTATASPWCWRCSRRAAACRSALNDIYLNVAGGLRIAEPAADLAVAAALVSALSLQPVPPETVVFGEIGLSGEVRPVGQAEARLKEAAKLGFTAALAPAYRGRGKERSPPSGITLRELRHLRHLVDLFEDQPRRAQRSLATPGARR